ncbi:MAG: transposase [Thermoanaerobaculaceae bacterium]|jgi:REP element-mobilizing transposase RayT
MELPQRKLIRLDAGVYHDDGRVFSVTLGTHPRADTFRDIGFGIKCIQLLDELSARTGNRVFAYCLKPDHVHLLVESTSNSPLPSFVGAWKSECYRVQRQEGESRRFWQRGFYDHALRRSDDLRDAALYILFNPVRKGLVADFHSYPLCGSFVFEV